MASYRNERIPPFEFLIPLRRVDENLSVVFDSLSMRWDILFRDVEGTFHNVLRVCERDSKGNDVGYMPLDDRTIKKLLRMDLKRRNMSPEQYKNAVRKAEDVDDSRREQNHEKDMDYVFQHEHRTLERARDALRGVYRRY